MKLDHMKSRGFELRLEEINRAIEKGLEGRRKPSDRAIIEKWRKYANRYTRTASRQGESKNS